MLVGLVVRLDQDRRAHRPGVLDALVDVGHLDREVHDTVAVLAVVVEHRAVGGDAAGEDEAGAARSAARRTWRRGGRSRGRGRPRAPCRARAGSRPRSGWRCRPRSRRRPGPRPGTGRCVASYSTRPTSCLSCSRESPAWTSSLVRAVRVDSLMACHLSRGSAQSVQQYGDTLRNSVHFGAAHGRSRPQIDRPVRHRPPRRRARGVPPARRRPRHRPGPARQARLVRAWSLVGARPLPRRAGLPGHRVPHPRDPPGRARRRRPRHRRRPPGRHPRGARGAHHHRRRRPDGPGGRPLQHRPAAGHRPGPGEPSHRALVHGHRAGHPGALPGAPARSVADCVEPAAPRSGPVRRRVSTTPGPPRVAACCPGGNEHGRWRGRHGGRPGEGAPADLPPGRRAAALAAPHATGPRPRRGVPGRPPAQPAGHRLRRPALAARVRRQRGGPAPRRATGDRPRPGRRRRAPAPARPRRAGAAALAARTAARAGRGDPRRPGRGRAPHPGARLAGGPGHVLGAGRVEPGPRPRPHPPGRRPGAGRAHSASSSSSTGSCATSRSARSRCRSTARARSPPWSPGARDPARRLPGRGMWRRHPA